MSKNVGQVVEWSTNQARLESSYRRLVTAHLPVNLYGVREHAQRRAATLLHGMSDASSLWEELDCIHLADDERGDRTSLLLGGATGGVALNNLFHKGLFAATGQGTLFLTNVEKLSYPAQRVLSRMFESGRYTPVGDPFPRPINCRLIVGTSRPLMELWRRLIVSRELADALGQISLRAEEVLKVLEHRNIYKSHPSSLAAAS